MKSIFSLLIQCFCLFLPFPLRRILLQVLVGFQINPTARIGFSLLLSRTVVLGDHALIGSLTLVRRLEELRLCEYSRLGSMNWISGGQPVESAFFGHRRKRYPSLILERHSGISGHHRIDATDSVKLGAYSTIAGNSTQIWTHSIELEGAFQDCKPVEIGCYCFIGTRSILLPGTRIPDYCVIGAGSVVTADSLVEPYVFYGGVPARPIRPMSRDAKYFLRTRGLIE